MRYAGKTLYFKQGETFSFAGALMGKESGELIDAAGITARSQIRRATQERELIATLTCEWLRDSVVRIHFDGDTTEWAAGNALWDVQVVDSEGQVRVTESIAMVIDRYVTKSP